MTDFASIILDEVSGLLFHSTINGITLWDRIGQKDIRLEQLDLFTLKRLCYAASSNLIQVAAEQALQVKRSRKYEPDQFLFDLIYIKDRFNGPDQWFFSSNNITRQWYSYNELSQNVIALTQCSQEFLRLALLNIKESRHYRKDTIEALALAVEAQLKGKNPGRVAIPFQLLQQSNKESVYFFDNHIVSKREEGWSILINHQFLPISKIVTDDLKKISTSDHYQVFPEFVAAADQIIRERTITPPNIGSVDGERIKLLSIILNLLEIGKVKRTNVLYARIKDIEIIKNLTYGQNCWVYLIDKVPSKAFMSAEKLVDELIEKKLF